MLRELIGGQHQHRENHDGDAGRRSATPCGPRESTCQRRGLETGRGDGSRPRRGARDIEVAQLLLDEAAQLNAVVALELTELADAALQRRALALQARDLVAALGLCLGEDRRGLGLRLGDELVALGLALGDVLVVQAGSATATGAGTSSTTGAGSATGSGADSAGAGAAPDSYAASLALSSSFSAMVLRHSTTISSRKSSTSSGSNPSLNRTCWNCLVTTSSGVKAMVLSSFRA
jgi:hypothetical protein